MVVRGLLLVGAHMYIHTYILACSNMQLHNCVLCLCCAVVVDLGWESDLCSMEYLPFCGTSCMFQSLSHTTKVLRQHLPVRCTGRCPHPGVRKCNTPYVFHFDRQCIRMCFYCLLQTLGQMASAQAVSTSAEAATVPVSSQPGSPSHDEGAVTDPGPAEGGKKLEDRVRDTEALIARRRQQKLQEEQERSKLKEAQRRFEGKGMVEAKRTHKEQANQLWIQERVKQKEEERRARADILAKLEQDKEERRKARQSTAPQQGGASSTGHSVVRQRVAVSAASSTSPTSKTRLQFRLPQGGSVVQQFGSSSTLRDAREFIVEVRVSLLHTHADIYVRSCTEPESHSLHRTPPYPAQSHTETHTHTAPPVPALSDRPQWYFPFKGLE